MSDSEWESGMTIRAQRKCQHPPSPLPVPASGKAAFLDRLSRATFRRMNFIYHTSSDNKVAEKAHDERSRAKGLLQTNQACPTSNNVRRQTVHTLCLFTVIRATTRSMRKSSPAAITLPAVAAFLATPVCIQGRCGD